MKLYQLIAGRRKSIGYRVGKGMGITGIIGRWVLLHVYKHTRSQAMCGFACPAILQLGEIP